MDQSLSRTFATTLSDDELILLDVMFDGGASFRLLRQIVFQEQWNYHSHNLSDDQLQETLQRLVNSGLLAIEQHEKRTYFQVTSEGGHLWETERLPVWHRFATDKYGETPSGKPFVTITATSMWSRDDFWRIGCEVGMFPYSNGRIRTTMIKNHVLIPWKKFPIMYVLVAVLDEWPVSIDWVAFEARRTWWRFVRENIKFL